MPRPPKKKKAAPRVDLLAVMAHPDDAELACAGTFIRAAKQGHKTGVIDLTRGEMGTRGTPAQRAREAAAATRVMKLHHRENLGLPDSRLEVTNETKALLAARIRALRPRVVILPYWEARHPDHSATSRLGAEACYLAGLAKMDLPGKPHRPHRILYSILFDASAGCVPSFVVDITPHFRQRMRAVACYGSQLKGPKRQRGVYIPLTGADREIATRCAYYGALIGAEYGEPFISKEPLEVEDITRLGGRPF